MFNVAYSFGININTNTFRSINRFRLVRNNIYPSKIIPLSCTSTSTTSEETDNTKDIISNIEDLTSNETDEEKYKREKLAEIAERKAAEVFVTRQTGKYECQSCGYIYDTSVGMAKKGIVAGTPFDEIEKFRCPQCGASKKYFVAEEETLSGFKENLKYGLGGNAMTAGQKQNIIFGGIFLGFIVFLSGYLLE